MTRDEAESTDRNDPWGYRSAHGNCWPRRCSSRHRQEEQLAKESIYREPLASPAVRRNHDDFQEITRATAAVVAALAFLLLRSVMR